MGSARDTFSTEERSVGTTATEGSLVEDEDGAATIDTTAVLILSKFFTVSAWEEDCPVPTKDSSFESTAPESSTCRFSIFSSSFSAIAFAKGDALSVGELDTTSVFGHTLLFGSLFSDNPRAPKVAEEEEEVEERETRGIADTDLRKVAIGVGSRRPEDVEPT